MAADSRSITTDALAVLGTIIDDTVGRDAIHLAVEPVIATVDLEPGARITAPQSDGFVRHAVYGRDAYGIVDPFLETTVKAGQRFLMVLMPRQIATLRHVWDHPAFPASQAGGVDLGVAPAARPSLARTERDSAIVAITSYGDTHNVSYETVVQDFMAWSKHGDEPWYVNYDEGDVDSVWDALDTLLGVSIERGEIDLSCRGC